MNLTNQESNKELLDVLYNRLFEKLGHPDDINNLFFSEICEILEKEND